MTCVLRREEEEVPAEPFSACMTWSEQEACASPKHKQRGLVLIAGVEDWFSTLRRRMQAQDEVAHDEVDMAGRPGQPPRPPRLPCREPASPLGSPSSLWGIDLACTEDLPVNFVAVRAQRASAQRQCGVTLHAGNLENFRRELQDSEGFMITAS